MGVLHRYQVENLRRDLPPLQKVDDSFDASRAKAGSFAAPAAAAALGRFAPMIKPTACRAYMLCGGADMHRA
jgi:hypothetical protein